MTNLAYELAIKFYLEFSAHYILQGNEVKYWFDRT